METTEPTTKKLKLMILIPMEATILYDSAMSIINLFASLKESGVDYMFFSVSGAAHAFARNALFRKAIEELKAVPDYTHIVLIDSDHTFGPGDVIRLIQNKEEFGTDIVGAAYLTKNEPISLVALRATEYSKEDPELPVRYALIRQFELHKMYAVDALGFGMVVFHPSVLQKMVEYYGTTELAEFRYRDGIVVGEDVMFCQKAKKLGMTIDVSTDVVLGHVVKGIMDIDYAKKVYNTDLIGTISLFPKEDPMNVPGWLTDKEGECLEKYAKNNKIETGIVEIGSWVGRSTIRLAKGSLEGHKGLVFAIDPHEGSPEHQKDGVTINTFPEFESNIKKAGVDKIVIPQVKTSEEAALLFMAPVGTIFIDGNHSYESVKQDFELWLPKIVTGGKILFHDATNWPGPIQLTTELMTDSRVKYIETVDSIRCFEKV